MSKMSGTQKSSICFEYVYHCTDCDFEATNNSEKQQKMRKRLHEKKCKKTGRTTVSTLETDKLYAHIRSGAIVTIDDAYNEKNNASK